MRPSYRMEYLNTDNIFQLLISDVKEEDAGCYQCTVSNKAGQCSSLAALIVQSRSYCAKKIIKNETSKF